MSDCRSIFGREKIIEKVRLQEKKGFAQRFLFRFFKFVVSERIFLINFNRLLLLVESNLFTFLLYLSFVLFNI